MSESWYGVTEASEPLTQGDLILRCPLANWKPGAVHVEDVEAEEALAAMTQIYRADVVVMTQACDLEHNKVENVVLCPHFPLSEFRARWEQAVEQAGQNPTAKAWRRTCEDIAAGHVWNQTFLNSLQREAPELELELRLVEFRQVMTVPRHFLESLLQNRNEPRLRLLAPYREHLSQAFARFFMRVGLPQGVERQW